MTAPDDGETAETAETGWYRGDCHVHSAVSSGGELTPEQLAADARAAGLDFIATTEHNRTDTHRLWGPHAGDGLLVILGQEVVTRTGHWLALGLEPGQVVGWDHDAGTADAINPHLRAVRQAGGLCVAAHPHAPYDSGTFRYPLDGFDLVEVWNGLWSSSLPWNADNEAALTDWARSLADAAPRGRWRPAIGNSDVHLAGQLGTPHTVVRADELSTTAVLAALRAGRSWIAESHDVDLSFTMTAGNHRAEIGERLSTAAVGEAACETTGDAADALVAVHHGPPHGIVSLHTDVGEVYRQALPATGSGAVTWRTRACESRFVRVEVRHPDGAMAALTNPILLT
jgi:predicted metal-dependent phosphoesterase TrpH